MRIENRIKMGYHQQTGNTLVGIAKLDITTIVSHGFESSNKDANAR